jgi:hypothetical protein
VSIRHTASAYRYFNAFQADIVDRTTNTPDRDLRSHDSVTDNKVTIPPTSCHPPNSDLWFFCLGVSLLDPESIVAVTPDTWRDKNVEIVTFLLNVLLGPFIMFLLLDILSLICTFTVLISGHQT